MFVKNILLELREVDSQSKAAATAAPLWQSSAVIVTAAFILLGVHYLKYQSAFIVFLHQGAELWSGQRYAWQQAITEHPLGGLASLAWWSLVHLIGYLVLPLLIVRFWFKQPLSQYGLQRGCIHRHTGWYLLLVLPIFFFIYLVSDRADFLHHYPFYKLAHRSWLDLICWELLYIFQFIALEFFFRGFMVHGLKHEFGLKAVLVMCLPYLMIHFPKPWLEATGAIAFGLCLGLLSMVSRSIWGGVLVHIAIATTMDIVAITTQYGMPDQIYPPGW